MVEDTQDLEYHPTLEEEYSTSDSEDEIVARRDATPSTVVSVAKNLVSRSTTV